MLESENIAPNRGGVPPEAPPTDLSALRQTLSATPGLCGPAGPRTRPPDRGGANVCFAG